MEKVRNIFQIIFGLVLTTVAFVIPGKVSIVLILLGPLIVFYALKELFNIKKK